MDAEKVKAFSRKYDSRKRKELLLMHDSGTVMSLDGSYILLQEQSSDQCLKKWVGRYPQFLLPAMPVFIDPKLLIKRNT